MRGMKSLNRSATSIGVICSIFLDNGRAIYAKYEDLTFLAQLHHTEKMIIFQRRNDSVNVLFSTGTIGEQVFGPTKWGRFMWWSVFLSADTASGGRASNAGEIAR